MGGDIRVETTQVLLRVAHDLVHAKDGLLGAEAIVDALIV